MLRTTLPIFDTDTVKLCRKDTLPNSTVPHLDAVSQKRKHFDANIIHYKQKAKADHSVKHFSEALPQMPLRLFQHALH